MLDDRSYMRATRRPYWSATTILLVSLGICFIIQTILVYRTDVNVEGLFALSDAGLKKHFYWQLLTFQFLHGGFLHLAGNGLGLYFFGRAMEEALGSKGMLLLYFLSGTIGGLAQVLFGLAFGLHYLVLGASAGVFGLIAAFAVRSPNEPITMFFFFLPITFPAKVLLALEGGYAIANLFVPLMGGTAHAAHLGGMLTGILFMQSNSLSSGAWRPFSKRSAVREPVSAGSQRAWRRPRKSDETAGGDFISREVDPILEKISAHGIHSLTERERQILEAARKKMARR